MRTRPTPRQRETVARRTGLAYLGIIGTGVVAEFAVRASLVVDDDPIATAENIAEAPALFGAGIAADVVMIALDVLVAFGLLGLLRDVDRRLALTATAMRLVQGAVIVLNLNFLVRAMISAHQATASPGVVLPGPAGDALDAVERHALGYDAGLVAFGLSCLVLARLLAEVAVPRRLVVGMAATGVIYLVGSFAAFFAPAASAVIEPFYAVCLIVELTFAVRLLTRGLDIGPTAPTPATPVPIAA